jgi:prepilin-type N-terminal cleavage/methylation domain-containing protein
MKQSGKNRQGFTLLEMLISAVLAAFIALVAMAGLRSVTAVRATVDRHSESSDELRIAAEQIRSDLDNVVPLGKIIRFEGQVTQDGSAGSPRLIFRTLGPRKARKDKPESELYEVEYFVAVNNSVKTLMRRVCPITGIDSTTTEEKTDGGVLEALAEPIASFDVGYFDSGNWASTWSADNQRPPQLVLINLAVDCTVAGGKTKLFTRQIAAGFNQSQFNEEAKTSDFSWEQMEDQWTQSENEG